MCPKTDSESYELTSRGVREVFSPAPLSFLPEKNLDDGSTPSAPGSSGEPSPSEVQEIADALRALLTDARMDLASAVGLLAVPLLTGPLTISGSGSPDSGGAVHPLVSGRSKKVGEDGFIFTLYLDQRMVESVLEHCGNAGSSSTVGLSFSVSTLSGAPLAM